MTTLHPHSDNPAFQTVLSAFTFAAYHGSAFASKTIEAETQQEMDEMAADMLEAQKTLHANHNGVQFKGVRGKSVTLSYNGANLRVQVAKQPKHTNVTQTSRDAYHSLDLGEACKDMAIFAIGAMMRDGYCTDRGVERRSNGEIRSNLVSARRADIVKAGGIKMADGSVYVIEMTGETVKDRVTGRSANTWKIKQLKEPAADSVQMDLFNAKDNS